MEREEKILICLSGSPSNARVIRAGAKLAEAFRGTVSALFVEPPHFEHFFKIKVLLMCGRLIIFIIYFIIFFIFFIIFVLIPLYIFVLFFFCFF